MVTPLFVAIVKLSGLSISSTTILEMEVHLLYWPQDMIEYWNGSYFSAPRLFGFKETSLSQDQVFVISLFSPFGLGLQIELSRAHLLATCQAMSSLQKAVKLLIN